MKKDELGHIEPYREGWYVRCRYEYAGKDGKAFTEWFLVTPLEYTDNEARCRTLCEVYTAGTKELDRRTGLRHEYMPYFINADNDPVRNLEALRKEAEQAQEDVREARAALRRKKAAEKKRQKELSDKK